MNQGLIMTADASGAASAAERGMVVMVVDIIDMSTTLEAAIDEGAFAVFGASPDSVRAPVKLNPRIIGENAGRLAILNDKEIILVSEPRTGSYEKLLSKVQSLLRGIEAVGGKVHAILPNIGAETVKLANFRDKIVIAATHTGGVAFDAAVNAGACTVLTGTVARTKRKKGIASAEAAAERAIREGQKRGTGLAIVAASSNSLEDILAAEYITRLIVGRGFLKV